MPPQPVTPWKGIREATAFSKWPPQAFPTMTRLGYLFDDQMSEDCLYLNVITPAKSRNDRLPVMVWFHGGGITTQSGTRAGYNTPAQAQGGVVTVSVSGRLDVMGFLALKSLSAESPYGASGNYGMLDLVAALHWVKNNIAQFGGDPEHIGIWGQSGGGEKVCWLMASPLTTGLFTSAVAQSGIGVGATLATAEANGEAVLAALSPPLTDDAAGLAALRALPWEDIQKAETAAHYSANVTIDGWSQTDTIPNVFAKGEQQNVPFMVGLAHTEWGGPSAGTGATAISFLAGLKSSGSPTYAFVHTRVPPGWLPALAWHSFENGYIFRDPVASAPNNFVDYGIPAGAPYTENTSIFVGYNDAGWTVGRALTYSCGPTEEYGLYSTNAGWNCLDTFHRDYMFETWAHFAATGDPNLPPWTLKGPPLPKWPPYTVAVDKFMALDAVPVVETGYSHPGVGGALPIPPPVFTCPFYGYTAPPPF
jgi:para-nitrobenzyl esterase